MESDDVNAFIVGYVYMSRMYYLWKAYG